MPSADQSFRCITNLIVDIMSQSGEILNTDTAGYDSINEDTKKLRNQVQ
jgi:hypothetical protein